MRSIVLLLTVFLTGTGAARGATLDEGITLFEARRWPEARAALTTVVDREPGNARACAYLGVTLLNWERDFDGAIARLEKAVALDPATARYQVWLGSVYAAKAQDSGIFKAASYASKAKGAFERAAAVDPSSVEAHEALFQYYLFAPGIAGGSVAKAREQVAALAGLDPVRGVTARASLAEYGKDIEGARRILAEAVALRPDRAELRNTLGYLFLRQKRPDEAIEQFRAAVELEPRSANAYDSLGDGLLAAGRVDEAMASYRQALVLDERFLSSVWGLAECHSRRSEWTEARARLTRYLELVPAKGRGAERAHARLAEIAKR